MFRWARKESSSSPASLGAPGEEPASGASPNTSPSASHEAPPSFPPAVRKWAPRFGKVLPFFFSALLYLSAFFAFLSPLPLLAASFLLKRPVFWAALALNGALVWIASGQASALIYLVFVLAPALTLPELLKKKFSLESAVAASLGVIFATGAILVVIGAYRSGQSPWMEIRTNLNTVVAAVVESVPPATREGWIGTEGDQTDWIRQLKLELPSATVICAFLMVLSNLLLLLRLNPAGLQERLGVNPALLKRWTAPDWLLWPTIVAGFVYLMNWGWVTAVGMNVFRFFMAVYAIQGLAILGFYFDAWRIRGFVRSVGFMIAIFLMLPLVLSLGFFDQWFDFRAKLRQS